MKVNKTYLLVRDPVSLKKDSIHYGDKGLFDAKVLMEHLRRVHGEECQLFEIDIVRGTCSSVEATHA